MSSGPTHSILVAPRILSGTVRTVDVENYRVEVAWNDSQGSVPDVQVCSAYCHPADGEESGGGLPEPGAQVKVFIPSEGGGRPFIQGYFMPPTSVPGESGGRRRRVPGDIISRTRGGAFCVLRRGGVVELGASPLAQTMYLPLGNMIRSFFMQKEEISPIGELRWTHADIGSDGTTKATLSFEHRDAVEDLFPKLHLTVSSDRLDLMPEGYTSARPDETYAPRASFLRLKLDGGEGLSQANVLSEMALQVSESGDIYLHGEGYTLIDSAGSLRMETRGNLDFITPLAYDTTTVGGYRTIEAMGIDMQAHTALALRAPRVILEGSVLAGGPTAVDEVPKMSVLVPYLTTLAAALGLPPPPPGMGSTALRVL